MGRNKEASWRGLAQCPAQPLTLPGSLPTMVGQASPSYPQAHTQGIPVLFSWQPMGPAHTNSTAGRPPPPAPLPTPLGMRRTAW